jgi:sucrose-phosphate synthase
MYIQMVSVHGLIRGEKIEMGRDADTGGQVRYVLELAKALSQFDEVERVDLFTRRIRDKRVSEDYSQRVEPLGPKANLVRISCGGARYMRKEKLWPHLDYFVEGMISFARQEGLTPALVHGHYADAGYIAREAASAFGVPFAFTGHSLGRDKLAYLISQEKWSPEKLEREFHIQKRIEEEEASLAAADLVVASTRHEVETQYGRYRNGRRPRLEIIPPGTDLDRFFPYYEYQINGGAHIDEKFKQARARMTRQLERFLVDRNKPLILALCRPDRRKNIGALVEAYGGSKELQALANLAIFAGIRENIDEMEESERQVLTDILHMMDRYDLYGKMAIPKRHDSETDVPELYRLAAERGGVFVNAAFVEPFGLTFIEASAAGLPFAGTRNGGPSDIVANCESGLLVDAESREELAEAIKKLITHRELWERCSTNGINRSRERYSWQAHCERYLECVRDLRSSFAAGTQQAASASSETETLGSAETSAAASETASSTLSGGSSVSASAPNSRPAAPETRTPVSRLESVKRLLLADIDNTLLGDPAALERLLDFLEANRGRLGFGVATGRYLEKALEVLKGRAESLLDVVVSSVGTEIYYGLDLVPDRAWAEHLRAKWHPEKVREALDPLPFLRLQKDPKTQRKFKISYDLSQSTPPEQALAQIREALSQAEATCNLIFSHGVYVDLLPYRASKGKAIRHLSRQWGIPLERIAAAGDSGNDRDMLVGRGAGIIVGNYDQDLAALKDSKSRVYFAQSRCAAGILEGLEHYGFARSRKALPEPLSAPQLESAISDEAMAGEAAVS